MEAGWRKQERREENRSAEGRQGPGPSVGHAAGWGALPEEKANQKMEKERSVRKEGPEKQRRMLQGAGRALLWLCQTHKE